MKFEVWFPLLVGLGPTIIGLYALRGQYKKESAEASSITVDSAIRMMNKLEKRVDRQGVRIRTLERNETEYVKCLRKLIKQIEKEGLVPVVSLEQVNNIALEVQT